MARPEQAPHADRMRGAVRGAHAERGGLGVRDRAPRALRAFVASRAGCAASHGAKLAHLQVTELIGPIGDGGSLRQDLRGRGGGGTAVAFARTAARSPLCIGPRSSWRCGNISVSCCMKTPLWLGCRAGLGRGWAAPMPVSLAYTRLWLAHAATRPRTLASLRPLRLARAAGELVPGCTRWRSGQRSRTTVTRLTHDCARATRAPDLDAERSCPAV